MASSAPIPVPARYRAGRVPIHFASRGRDIAAVYEALAGKVMALAVAA